MAADLNLNAMSKKELERLKAKIEKALEKNVEKEKKAARDAAEKAAKSFGFSLADLGANAPAPKKAAKKAATKGKAKFRNPDNASQTWTGKGRKPNWFIAALDAGKSEADLAI